MKPPAFQFYAAEYLADEHVQLMTLEEEGAYIRLLSFCWREGSIPEAVDALSRLCKGASTTVLATVLKRFKPNENGDRLIHPRLEAERRKQQEWREKSAQGGKASARKRKHSKGQIAEQGGSTTIQPPATTNSQATRLNTSSSSAFTSSSSSSPSGEKQERPAKKQQDERSTHPALVAVREVKGRFPSKDVWDLIIEKVGSHPDVPKMRECWVAWRTRNYAPENLGWLVDWYFTGVPSTNGARGSKVDGSMAAVREVMEEYKHGN